MGETAVARWPLPFPWALFGPCDGLHLPFDLNRVSEGSSLHDVREHGLGTLVALTRPSRALVLQTAQSVWYTVLHRFAVFLNSGVV